MTDLVELAQVSDVPAAPERKLTSADLKIGLRGSRGEGYAVFFEVGNDTGTKVTRHADAVAIGIWPSTGHQIHGYEIKVSRGDFLSEMKNPQKAWPVMRFCHRWSLLTPPGLVKVDELPPNWGLQTYDGRIMRTVKQAPMLQPEALSGGFVAAMVRRAGEQDAELIRAAVQKALIENKATNAAAVERARASWEREHDRGHSDAREKLAKYEELFGKMNKWDIERIAPILNAIVTNGADRVASNLIYQQKQLEQASAAISAAIASMPA